MNAPDHNHSSHDGGSSLESQGLDDAFSRDGQTHALKVALVVTLTFMVAEFLGGWWTNSLALLADAGHMLTDAGALGLSLFASWIVRRPATPEKTYGYFRVEILAALLNGTALFVIAGFILFESYRRFLAPEMVRSREMLIIAVLGLLANLYSARVLHRGHGGSLNVHGAFLHVIGDILGSMGAIIASLLILTLQAYWADPAVSALVSLLIVFSAWRLVQDSIAVLLEGTPAHINLGTMEMELRKIQGVESVHDLHVWTLTSGMHAMTCHLVVRGQPRSHEILREVTCLSKSRFNVHHTTIQIEQEQTCPSETRFCN